MSGVFVTYDALKTAVWIEVVRFCAASSIWSFDLSEILRLVSFSRFFEKELQLTGPFAKEGRGGLW
jgi:hypothetical protein